MKRIELLAPGGDLSAIKAAVIAGADAVYCGLDKLNARHRAANISLADLGGVLALAHRHDCRVFLTLNIMMVESDFPVLVGILNRLANTTIDGVIVQDPGLFHLLATRFPGLEVHASTQLTTHNEGQIRFLGRLGASRVNLSRELSLDEIRPLARACAEEGIATEVFVHGSHCLSFSGICYMSSVQGGNSGNRGRCSQPCRARYATTPAGNDWPLNLKDNSAYFDLERLVDAGVDALKIEGRMKPAHYVYVVTRTYRRRLRSLTDRDGPVDESGELHRVFNRDFSNGYLMGDIGRQMFSDHPRNRSADQLDRGDRDEAYDEIAAVKAEVREQLEGVRVAQVPLTIRVSGKAGAPLELSVHGPETPFAVSSESRLVPQRSDSTVPSLDAEWLLARLKAVNDTEHRIERLDLDGLEPGLFLPQGELTSIKNSILLALNGKAPVDPVRVETPVAPDSAAPDPTLSVLVASTGDLHLCDEARAEVFFALPGAVASRRVELIELLAGERRLVPWFPSVLIGDDYAAAVELLKKVRPERLVTNNTGIAHEAWRTGIPWIAGPQLNIANSLGLVCLKQRLGCRGAFVSGELGEHQIRRICAPEGFELHYSIYHPIVLLTSRQCLFLQVTGCEKDAVDRGCLTDCERSAMIRDSSGAQLFINKSRGSHCRIHHHANFLNTEVVVRRPAPFSGFLIDLRDVETGTRTELDKSNLVQLFEDLLRGRADPGELERRIAPTTHGQYRKAI